CHVQAWKPCGVDWHIDSEIDFHAGSKIQSTLFVREAWMKMIYSRRNDIEFWAAPKMGINEISPILHEISRKLHEKNTQWYFRVLLQGCFHSHCAKIMFSFRPFFED